MFSDNDNDGSYLLFVVGLDATDVCDVDTAEALQDLFREGVLDRERSREGEVGFVSSGTAGTCPRWWWRGRSRSGKFLKTCMRSLGSSMMLVHFDFQAPFIQPAKHSAAALPSGQNIGPSLLLILSQLEQPSATVVPVTLL